MLPNSDAAPMAALLERCPEEHRDRLRPPWQSELLSASEVTKGTMLPPMTWRQLRKRAGQWVGGVEFTRPAPRHPMRADAMRRGAVSAGARGRERVSADALRRKVMGAYALRRGAVSACARGRERVSADAPRGDAR